MKIGFGIPNNQGLNDPNDLVTLAVTAENLGFDSVWVREHLFHSSSLCHQASAPWNVCARVALA